MGNWLQALRSKPEEKQEIFLNFEDVKPTEAELKIWQEVNHSCSQLLTILQELSSYGGATSVIREAIASPNNEESLQVAWQAVCPLVARLKVYYEFSLVLENVVKELLTALCSAEVSIHQHLETHQALVKQFADIVHFALKFDEIKVNNPAIQNDFSFFRRTANRIQDIKGCENNSGVSTAIANKMSLFYAQSTPMLQMLITTTNIFVNEQGESLLTNTTECLCTIANICCTMVEQPLFRSKFVNSDTVMYCLRVMVGVIVLYDHVNPSGAFVKDTQIDVKNCIKVIQNESTTQTENKNDNSIQTEALMNVLRYNSKHLMDKSTPKSIRQMFS